MLHKLLVRDFKSIVEAELDFGRVNVFIGTNGSGKSNLLEAIGMISACLSKGIDMPTLDGKGVRLSQPHVFKSSFKERNMPANFSLEAHLNGIAYTAELSAEKSMTGLQFHKESLVEGSTEIVCRKEQNVEFQMLEQDGQIRIDMGDNMSRSAWDACGSLIQLAESGKQAIRTMAQYALYTPQTAVMRGLVSDHGSNEPLGLYGGRLARALRELLDERENNPQRKREIDKILQIIWGPGWAYRVIVGEPNMEIIPDILPTKGEMVYFRDRFLRTEQNTLSPYDASEGTLYLLFVAVLLAHSASPRIFALDNADGTLNPQLVRSLMEHITSVICSDKNAESSQPRTEQVFLTSHNPTALDALDLFNDDHRLFVVSRDSKTGATEFHPLRPPEGMTKQKWIETHKGRNLSQLWLEGWIPKSLRWTD